MKAQVLASFLMLLLAGCQAPVDETNDPSQPPNEELPPAGAPPGFDGMAAYAFVAGLITDDAGEPRFRVPGTPGHAEAAQWLWAQLDVSGWQRSWHNFTYADYAPLDKGPAQGYAYPESCSADDRERLEETRFHNLVAIHRAPEGSDRLFLMGAHWESKEEASQDTVPAKRKQPVLGANDGASGVGVLLQLMRHVAQGHIEVPFDIGVVFFDAEDGFEDCHPLAGSVTFVAQLEPGEVDRFLLLDMVGDPAARFMRESRSVQGDPELVDLLWHYGKAYAPDNFLDKQHSVLDDHVPFLEAGIPAVDLIDFARGPTARGFPPYWHTTEDTLDKLSPAMLGTVGDIVWRVMADPAFDQSLVDLS